MFRAQWAPVAARATEQNLTDVSWDLDPLVDGGGDEAVPELLEEAERAAKAFADRWRGRVEEFGAEELQSAMDQLAGIYELASRAASYAMLRHSVDTADPALGALWQTVQERLAAIENELLFFDLEWQALPEERAEQLLSGPGSDRYAHHLRVLHRYAEHRLSEPEERILNDAAVTGRRAFQRLLDEQLAAIRVSLDEELTLDQALALLDSPDREERRRLAEAISEALEPGLRTRTFIFNILAQDKATQDRLRRFPHWLASRNLANEASDESVEALVEAVRGRYQLVRRWYRLKARLLGLERLTDYDRRATVTDEKTTIEWPQAREIVLDAYASFSPELADLAARFFDERWIDAPPRPGKRGGAFSASAVPSVHPYVMLNYTSRPNDVLTLAHELGHGLHQALARPQGILQQTTPLTVAETASVFGETVTFGRLLEASDDPQRRLALLAEDIEGAIGTVFRQISLHTFEAAIHAERRGEGELSPDRFGELWSETQGEMFGDSLQMSDGYRIWWSYIHHFTQSPGYVYAYAFGQLLAMSIYSRYLDQGEAFVPRYLEMLSAGGSRSPEELGRIVGVDLADPGFWDAGLDLVERRLEDAEAAAERVLSERAAS
jgi:oligoendopeptidase F